MPSPAPQSTPQKPHHEDRNVWVLTGYTVSFLSLLGVLVYYWLSLPK